MFSAKPIIASVDDDSDTAECVEKSGAGWVVHPEDIVSLSKAMQQAYNEPSEVLVSKGKSGFDCHSGQQNAVSAESRKGFPHPA